MTAVCKERITVIAIAAWALLALGGWAVLQAYSTRPGPAATQIDWPSGTSLKRTPGKPALVMFLHPRCPCSDASLAELERAVGNKDEVAAVHIVFSIPFGADAKWRSGDLIDQARELRGATITFDEGGLEAGRFGARTSGQVLLYDAAQRCVFSGGLTPSRGHEGETAARGIINTTLNGGAVPEAIIRAPVFGCALYRLPTTRPAAPAKLQRSES